MYSKEYSKRLVRFNGTPQYQAELTKLGDLLDLKSYHSVLDYGFGVGTALMEITKKTKHTFGYDVNTFEDSIVPDHPIWKGGKERFDRIYFMHSIAHIPNISDVLKQLMTDNLAPDGKIIVITPNKLWLRAKNGEDVKSDDTAIEHFTMRTLYNLFRGIGMTCDVGQYSYDEGTDFVYKDIELKERLYSVSHL